MSAQDPGDSTAAAVDPDVLAQICGGDAAFEIRVLGNFQRAADRDASGLRDAVARGDLAEATRLAHSAKGAAQTIGAGALASVCELIERAGRAGELKVVAAHLPQFDREISRVLTHIDRVLQARNRKTQKGAD
jgi:HPt (histidine-containing phosphotransfer) domain-containing protein